jgi:hypothetical protein
MARGLFSTGLRAVVAPTPCPVIPPLYGDTKIL